MHGPTSSSCCHSKYQTLPLGGEAPRLPEGPPPRAQLPFAATAPAAHAPSWPRRTEAFPQDTVIAEGFTVIRKMSLMVEAALCSWKQAGHASLRCRGRASWVCPRQGGAATGSAGRERV